SPVVATKDLLDADNEPRSSSEQLPVPTKDNTKPVAELQREQLLENVGSVSSIYLYQSYLNVGLLADAVENDTYTKKDAIEILKNISTLLHTVDRQMAKLEAAGLENEEVEAIQQIRKVSKLLKSQAGFLQTHWQTSDKAAFENFHEARQQSWTEL